MGVLPLYCWAKAGRCLDWGLSQSQTPWSGTLSLTGIPGGQGSLCTSYITPYPTKARQWLIAPLVDKYNGNYKGEKWNCLFWADIFAI